MRPLASIAGPNILNYFQLHPSFPLIDQSWHLTPFPREGAQNLYLAVAPASVLGVLLPLLCTFISFQGCQHHNCPRIPSLCCWGWTTFRWVFSLDNSQVGSRYSLCIKWFSSQLPLSLVSFLVFSLVSFLVFSLVFFSGPPLFGSLVDITSSYSLPLAIAATAQVATMYSEHNA